MDHPKRTMQGKQISHPLSTNYLEPENGPPLKRLKRFESADSVFSGQSSDNDDIGPDSPEGTPVRDERSSCPTDLENALPPIKNDKEAIAEYEASRAAEQTETNSRNQRLDQGKWTKGRSSIYVDAFNLALVTVLDEEAHLFDEKELSVFQKWRALDYEAQYLYVRLFLRKAAAWHRINRLRYHSDIADLSKALQVLTTACPLPISTAEAHANPGELDPPVDANLAESFTFADKSEDNITTLEEASSLLSLDELKAIAKDAKATGKNKSELLASFRRASRKQSGLEWHGLKRTVSEESVGSNPSSGEESPTASNNRDTLFLRKVLDTVGDCVRLSSPAFKLFERVHLVFYRSTEWTEKSLTTIILARISRRNFPAFVVSRSTNIFPSRSLLLEFEASIRTQFQVDNLLEFNSTKDRARKVLDIFEEVYPRWKILLVEEQRKEDREYESGEGAYLRRFSPAWVYTRIVHKGAFVMGRFKLYQREHTVLGELLDQRLFHAARRGAWYQRKALLEEHYMATLDPTRVSNLENQRKHWKRVSLQTCESGLQDKECHIIYHYDLQKRITKLEKSLKIPRREQHDFSHTRLVKAVERTIEGRQVFRETTPSRRNSASKELERRGSSTKTIWIDEHEDSSTECSVEEMCLSWYRTQQGWKGYHSEGGIVRTLFAYLFFDVMFVYIPNVFQTAFQTCPLDLHTDAFYPARLSEINARLSEISNGGAREIIRAVHTAHGEAQTCVIGLDWSFALEDLEEIADCFRPDALAALCRVMAQEYRVRGGGVPDLFLWHPQNKEVCFAEVKSLNDRLSDTQRLWIHVLTGAGVKVELCHALNRATVT